MSFKQFLQESTNQTELVLHQLLDNLDNGHLSYSDEKIEINIGQIIKKSSMSNLYLVIRASKTGNSEVRLAKSNENDNFTIVVDTTDGMPPRKEIDSFISSNTKIYKGISKEMTRYLEKELYDSQASQNDSELKRQHNTPDGFEEQYNNIVSSMDNKITEFNNMVADLKSKYDGTSHQGEKSSFKDAVAQLHKETLGDSFSAFSKIAKDSLTEKKFVGNMGADFKKKLDSRLSSYYEQKISNLGKLDW